jgi:Uncharacterized conserved protein
VKFFADEMLGKLARWLRMSGLDVSYRTAIPDPTLLEAARAESRIVLTRDTHLVRRLRPGEFLFISFDHLPEQMREFFRAYPSLRFELRPFSRCVECNVPLQAISKLAVKDRVWAYVYQTQEHFTFCPGCERIYWEATHVQKIREKLRNLCKE